MRCMCEVIGGGCLNNLVGCTVVHCTVQYSTVYAVRCTYSFKTFIFAQFAFEGSARKVGMEFRKIFYGIQHYYEI